MPKLSASKIGHAKQLQKTARHRIVLRKIESWGFYIINIVGRLIFKLIYGVKGKTMPAITDPILLESATSLARKIRKREVRMSCLITAK